MNYSKVTVLVKPCQSRKSWKMMEMVSEHEENIISIMFTDNSLLQSTQLCSRMEGFEGIEKNTTLTLSSKAKCKSANELPMQILAKGIKNIITCSNATRAKNIDELIETWSVFDPNNTKKFVIYIDEMDRFMTMYIPFLEKWQQNDKVDKIIGVTATPFPILKELGEVNIVKLEQTYEAENYHRFKDSEFVEYVMEKNQNRCYYELCLNMALENEHINAGNVFYFPGAVKKVTHYSIKNLCLNYGFACITINSDGCRLYNDPDDNKKFENIKTTGKEIATVLADLYENKHLNQIPLAITGQTCISRGVSLSSPRMMITHSILGPTFSNINNLYQSAGRLTNNMKQVPNFKKPIVYCTKRVRSSICLSEIRACELGSKAFKFDKDTVTVDDYKIANKKWIIKEEQFGTLTEVHNFLDRIVGERVRRNLNIHGVDGFYVSRVLNNSSIKIKDLRGHHRLLREEFETYPITRGFRTTDVYMVYPVYETELSEECTFIVRYKVV